MNVECPKCNKVFDNKKWSGHTMTYCSKSCASKRPKSQSSKEKISKRLKEAYEKNPQPWKRTRTHEEEQRRLAKCRETLERKYSEMSFDELPETWKRRKVFEEQDHACISCGLTKWLNQPILLELDHISGDRSNNSRDNLRGLCPNCHSQTDNWKGKKQKRKITDDEFLAALNSTTNIHQALVKLGLCKTGRHYDRARRLLCHV